MKPLIKKFGILWFCKGQDVYAAGLTPKDAYELWAELLEAPL